MQFYWCALLIAVCANIFANVAFKSAMRDVPGPLNLGAVATLFATPWMWAGLASAMLLLGCFLITIRGIDLSIAYPAITGLAMVGIVIAGYVRIPVASENCRHRIRSRGDCHPLSGQTDLMPFCYYFRAIFCTQGHGQRQIWYIILRKRVSISAYLPVFPCGTLL